MTPTLSGKLMQKSIEVIPSERRGLGNRVFFKGVDCDTSRGGGHKASERFVRVAHLEDIPVSRSILRLTEQKEAS